jgi:hypothetical protein
LRRILADKTGMYNVISDDQFGLLIERQRPLKEYRERVPDEAALLTSYADFLQRKFPAASPRDACAGCGGHGNEVRVFTWSALFHTNKTALWNAIGFIGALGGHGWTNYKCVDATTHHALCSGCYRALCARRVTGLLVEKICFAGLVIFSGATALLGIMLPLLLFTHPKAEEIARLAIPFVIAVTGLWLSIAGTRFIRRWQAPARIRSFIKHPFRMK